MMPSGGIGPGVFLHHRQGLRRKKIIMKYNSIFLKMFFLISGLILMSYITDVLQNNKF